MRWEATDRIVATIKKDVVDNGLTRQKSLNLNELKLKIENLKDNHGNGKEHSMETKKKNRFNEL